MMTELALSAGTIRSLTETPMLPTPEISPASLPMRALPGSIDRRDYADVRGLLRRANNRAAHAPADAANNDSQCHLVLQ